MKSKLFNKEKSNVKSKSFILLAVIALATVVLGWAMPAYAAKIRIVTTLTDLSDFARAVGGDLRVAFLQ